VTLIPLSFPREGQHSMGWKVTIKNTQSGETQDGDIILIQDGPYDMGLIDRTATDVDADLLQTTVQKVLVHVTKPAPR
jgi:hypothetical protein